MAETELDALINNLSYDLQNKRNTKYEDKTDYSDHVSRYQEHKLYNSEMTKTVKRTPTKSPRMPKRSTEEKGWYKSFCDEMGTPRGRQPYIFDSNVSDVRYRSTSELNQPYHSDYDSNYWGRRSSSLKRNFSPKSEKSVEFGPITEMVEKQEFYSHRDARHGKPLPGENGFMHTSWPFGLDHLGDAYRYRRREPMKSRSPSRSPVLWGLNRDGTPYSSGLGGQRSGGSGSGGRGSGLGGRGSGLDDGFGGRGSGLDYGLGGRGSGLNDGLGGRGSGLDDGLGGRGSELDDGLGGRGSGLDDGLGGRGSELDDGLGGRGSGLDDGLGGRGSELDDGLGGRGSGLEDGLGGRSGVKFQGSGSSRSLSPSSGDDYSKNKHGAWNDQLGSDNSEDDKNKSGSGYDDSLANERNKLIGDGKVAALKNRIESQEALQDLENMKKRSKSVPPNEGDIVKKAIKPTTKSNPTTPLPDLMSNLRHIKVSTVPVPVPPKFGTLSFDSANTAQGPVVDGPPCILCHKPITEKRCINHENFQYHCWHFVCSFCFKTLKETDFMMAVDNKPYCTNCFKRMFP